jgi:NADH dehydrogenase (ubiquinone) 1 alpha subcomplex subunit 13
MFWGHRRTQKAIAERRYRHQLSRRLKCFSELFREAQWARIHLTPLLEAENDRYLPISLNSAYWRDLYRRQFAAMEREREVMKDVPGWRPGENVYYGNRFS